MPEEKLASIAQYLATHFPDCEIEQRHDFDRGAQSFKLHLPKGTLLLKVGDEFVSDNDVDELMRLFDLFAVADALRGETDLGILVTQQGLSKFDRG